MVSVIIPTYNCSKYICGAIDSALSQTYTDMEIIVVDDGSTDNTKDMLASYMPYIRYVYQENRGLSGARNRGIAEAKGEMIAFLDADDLWLPQKIEVQVECLRCLPQVGLVSTDFSVFDETICNLDSYFSRLFPIVIENKLTLSQIYDREAIVKIDTSAVNYKVYHGNICKTQFMGNIVLPSSVLMRRKYLERIGLFNENYRVAEETEFFLRFSLECEFAFVDSLLVKYMVNRAGKLTKKSNVSLLILNAIQIQRDLIVKNSNFYIANRNFCNRAVMKSYLRLAHYYLTECQNLNAIRYALIGCTWYPLEMKLYFIVMLGLLIPPTMLKLALRVKPVLLRWQLNR